MLGLIQLDSGPFRHHIAQLVLWQFMGLIVKSATSLDTLIYDIQLVKVASKYAIIHLLQNTTTQNTTNIHLLISTLTYLVFIF